MRRIYLTKGMFRQRIWSYRGIVGSSHPNACRKGRFPASVLAMGRRLNNGARTSKQTCRSRCCIPCESVHSVFDKTEVHRTSSPMKNMSVNGSQKFRLRLRAFLSFNDISQFLLDRYTLNQGTCNRITSLTSDLFLQVNERYELVCDSYEFKN